MSISTDRLVGEIQHLFGNINEGKKNLWRFSNLTETIVPLHCLNCSNTLYDPNYFVKYGPDFGRNLWFCKPHEVLYHMKVAELKDAAKSEAQNYHALYEKAMEPLRKKEEKVEGYSETVKNEAKAKGYVVFEL